MVKQVQCPNCAAPKIEQGTSGHPLAVLTDIKVDTSLLAHDVAYRRLKERLGELKAARAGVQGRLDEARGNYEVALEHLRPVRPPWFWIIVGGY